MKYYKNLLRRKRVKFHNSLSNENNETNSGRFSPSPVLIIIFVISFLSIGGLASYHLLVKNQGLYVSKEQDKTDSHMSSLKQENVNKENESLISQGWTYKNHAGCKVSFPIPPKKPPFYLSLSGQSQENTMQEGEYWWDINERSGIYPAMISMILPEDQKYTQSVVLFHDHDRLYGSGYIPQAVVVSCMMNNQRFEDNDDLVSALKIAVDNYNQSELKPQVQFYAINEATAITRWGKSVVDILVQEDSATVSSTMFVTPDYVYEVRIVGEMNESSVNNTARTIFENIVFN
ncbi:MAG: hypothetical protein N3A54_06000 [Patescibacteria group bacterium]|nr:hypothetical protein [Patescibacteria group bacterium]